jgi:hypothetical protein
VRGFGAQSNDAEYINIDSIEPRLYFLTRMVMVVAQGKRSKARISVRAQLLLSFDDLIPTPFGTPLLNQ